MAWKLWDVDKLGDKVAQLILKANWPVSWAEKFCFKSRVWNMWTGSSVCPSPISVTSNILPLTAEQGLVHSEKGLAYYFEKFKNFVEKMKWSAWLHMICPNLGLNAHSLGFLLGAVHILRQPPDKGKRGGQMLTIVDKGGKVREIIDEMCLKVPKMCV